MKRSIIIGWGVVLIIIFLCVLGSFVFTQYQYSIGGSSTNISWGNKEGFSVIQEQGKLYNEASGDAAVVVTRTDEGYVPKDVTIHRGDIVEWKNESSDLHWPASNRHPIHDDYPAFDPNGAIIPGESWKFEFTQVGVWGYHDHVSARATGTITVIE